MLLGGWAYTMVSGWTRWVPVRGDCSVPRRGTCTVHERGVCTLPGRGGRTVTGEGEMYRIWEVGASNLKKAAVPYPGEVGTGTHYLRKMGHGCIMPERDGWTASVRGGCPVPERCMYRYCTWERWVYCS
jgi:hypothetical protein